MCPTIDKCKGFGGGGHVRFVNKTMREWDLFYLHFAFRFSYGDIERFFAVFTSAKNVAVDYFFLLSLRGNIKDIKSP